MANPMSAQNSNKSPEKLFQEIRQEMDKLKSKDPLSNLQVVVFNQCVATLRARLLRGDILGAREQWMTLQRENLLPHLGPADLETFTRLLPPLVPDGRSGAPWDPEQRDVIQEMALVAATGQYAAPLKVCMLYHIQAGNAEAALSLYSRYRKTTEGVNKWAGAEVEDIDDGAEDDTLVSILHKDPVRYSVGVAELLLCAVAAHAMRNSFYPALSIYLETSIRLTNMTTESFLNGFKKDLPLQEKVRTYIRNFETARLVSRPVSLSRQVSNLLASKNTTRLEMLYNSIRAGFYSETPWLAAMPDQVAPSRPVLMSENAWASLITAFIQCGRADLAEKVWDDIAAQGIPFSVIHWTAIIDGQGESGAVDQAIVTWREMLGQNVAPDVTAYRAIIQALFKHPKPAEAMQMFEDFKKTNVAADDKSLLVYNVVLHGLFSHGRGADARRLFDDMRTGGPKPDIVTYNTLLGYYGRRSDMKSLARCLQMLSDNNLTGDVFTFSTILSALLRIGRKDATSLMLNAMKKQGVEPNVATFTAIIRSAMEERDEDHLKACLDILQTMENDGRKDMQPTVATYSTLITGIVRGGFLSDALEDEYVQAMLKRMAQRDVHPNSALYNTLISTALQRESSGTLERALGYYREMRRRRIMTLSSWYILIHGLMQQHELGLAGEVVGDLLNSGIVLPMSLQRLVMLVRTELRAEARR